MLFSFFTCHLSRRVTVYKLRSHIILRRVFRNTGTDVLIYTESDILRPKFLHSPRCGRNIYLLVGTLKVMWRLKTVCNPGGKSRVMKELCFWFCWVCQLPRFLPVRHHQFNISCSMTSQHTIGTCFCTFVSTIYPHGLPPTSPFLTYSNILIRMPFATGFFHLFTTGYGSTLWKTVGSSGPVRSRSRGRQNLLAIREVQAFLYLPRETFPV